MTCIGAGNDKEQPGDSLEKQAREPPLGDIRGR